MSDAWLCPTCHTTVPLGEAASGTLAPIAGVDEPLCPFCGTELEVNPDIGAVPAPEPAPVEERAPWESDPDAWRKGGE